VSSRSIALTGMMGAGKSTVGRRLAEVLGRRVADTDDELRGWTGRSIPELFAEHGEPGFRRLERQVVAELARYHDLVLSLGGGVVLDDDNVAELLLSGVIVHLDVPVDELVARLQAAGEAADRPLLAGDLEAQVRTTHAARHERYLEVADLTVDATQPVDDVVTAICAWAMDQGDVLTPSEHEQVMTT
jgi:shikimate kinase